MKNCPCLIMAGTAGEKTALVFITPESLRWWFEEPAENPEVLGANTVNVFILDEIAYPKEFILCLPAKKLDTPPCGSACGECPMREKNNCPGCLSTLQYKG